MSNLLLTLVFLLAPAAQAATIQLCGTYDSYNKYFVGEVAPRSVVQKRVLALCASRRDSRSLCQQHLTCNTLTNRRPGRVSKVIPFPSRLRDPLPGPSYPRRPTGPSTPAPSPSPPSDPTPPPRNTSPGLSCRANNDCFSNQFCVGEQCFEKTGNGGLSCRSNSDCFSGDFCVSGQCFPKTGDSNLSCKKNSDCFSDQYCVSGSCFKR